MSLFSQDAKKRLLLLDGMALVYRAHFALIRSPRYTSGGVCTSAVFGMANTFFDLQKTWQPTHLAIAFDTEEPTDRHKEFPQYKAQRDALPEDIGTQLPLVKRLMSRPACSCPRGARLRGRRHYRHACPSGRVRRLSRLDGHSR